jgi:prepilin-type N-terminal cleavage/methylation domain-containing protein
MKNFSGLTLIELMVVVGILSIISAIAVPAYRGYIQTGLQSECLNEIAAIRLAEEEHFLQKNAYIPANTVIGTGAAADIATKSSNIYVPSSTALAAATTNCTYAVTLVDGYTIKATGTNKLPGTYSKEVKK